MRCHPEVSRSPAGYASGSSLAAKGFESAEQRRRGLAAADGHAHGLEHLAGLDAQAFGGGAQRGFEPVVREVGVGERGGGAFEDAAGQRGIALLGDQLGGVVGRQFVRRKRNRRR